MLVTEIRACFIPHHSTFSCSSDITIACSHYVYIEYCWLPSRIGIIGNTKADSAAKSALDLDISNDTVPYTDFKPLIREYTTALWEARWDGQETNKLHEIQPHLGYHPLLQYTRRESVVLHRCRIGHTHMTHSFLLKGEPRPQCIPCDCPLTMKHLFLDCIDFSDVRDNFYTASTMHDLFNRVNGHVVLNFLREINLFKKV